MKLTENTKIKIRVPKHLYEAIQAELDKKHMEEGEEYMEEGEEYMEEDVTTGAQIDAQKIGEIANMDPFAAGLLLVGAVAAGLIAGPKIAELAKIAINVAKDKGAGVANKLAGLFKKKGIKTDSTEPAPVAEELEEVFDMETLLEAVNDAAKKKKEKDAKKKAEEKKKKDAEDKKKKELAAKKKAEAAKKK